MPYTVAQRNGAADALKKVLVGDVEQNVPGMFEGEVLLFFTDANVLKMSDAAINSLLVGDQLPPVKKPA